MSAEKEKVKLHQHKETGKPYHKESNLVMKSVKEKLVIGKIDGKKFVELSEDNAEEIQELCAKYGFKMDPEIMEVEDEPKEEGSSSDEDVSSPAAPVTPPQPKKSEVKKEEKKEELQPVQLTELLARHSKELQEFFANVKSSSPNEEALRKELTNLRATLKTLLG